MEFRASRVEGTPLRAVHVKPGYEFKTYAGRKWRLVSGVFLFKEGDSELLRGNVIIMEPNCRQHVFREDEILLVKSVL